MLSFGASTDAESSTVTRLVIEVLAKIALFPWLEFPLNFVRKMGSRSGKYAFQRADVWSDDDGGVELSLPELTYCTFNVMFVVCDTEPTVPVIVSV
jgi:hypothetical protein